MAGKYKDNDDDEAPLACGGGGCSSSLYSGLVYAYKSAAISDSELEDVGDSFFTTPKGSIAKKVALQEKEAAVRAVLAEHAKKTAT